MANGRCGPGQASEVLRRSARTSNVKPRELAEMIVRNTAGAHGRRVLMGGR